MSDDMKRRWREAKLGERRDGKASVWVECDPVITLRRAFRGLCDVVPTDALRALCVRFDGPGAFINPDGTVEPFEAPPPGAFGAAPTDGADDVVVTSVDHEDGSITVSAAPRRKRGKRGAK